jgi:sugar transferase (PEP-CTERM/EpsH1 system associated)
MRWISGGLSLLSGKSATEGLFASRRLWSCLDRITSETKFAAVVVFCSSMVQYLALPGLRNVPAIVDLVDVDSQKFLDYAEQARGLKRWLYQLEAARLRRLESSLPERVQAITLVSEAEANVYRGFCPNQKTYAMSNGVDLDYFQPRKTPVKEFHSVFVGALDYPPNIDAMLWFCQEVWPGLKQLYPKATLAIVGRQPAPALDKLRSLPGVEIVGTVPDVRPYLAEAAAVIAPLRIARGIQNKVLEAMAMGKPVVASPEAREGLLANANEHLLCAATPPEWIKCIGKLYIEGSTRDRIGRAAWEYVHQHHRWSDCLSILERILNLKPRPKTSR